MSKRVLVTGVGGIVGQGILRNIIHLKEDLILVGTDINSLSAGSHLCQRVYEVPFSTDPRYIDQIKKICVNEKIDLIIPSTDYETYYLSLESHELPRLACAGPKVSEIFLNKYKTWQFFNEHQIPFAETALPSRYQDNFEEIIVKPLEGRGSRDLHFNPANYHCFPDDYIIQKLYRGKEITTAFYVTKEGSLLGHITLERELMSGYTDKCAVVFDYDKQVEGLILRMMQCLKLKCSYNIQSIVTETGDIIPFEVNGRVSGTNSIRSQFGFEDVRYIIDEYIFNRKPQKPDIKPGAALRILLDIIYPGVNLEGILNRPVNTNIAHYLFYK